MMAFFTAEEGAPVAVAVDAGAGVGAVECFHQKKPAVRAMRMTATPRTEFRIAWEE
jgi:hypothetical protein